MAIRSIITKDGDYTYGLGITRSFPSTNGVTFFMYLNILRQDGVKNEYVSFSALNEEGKIALEGRINVFGIGDLVAYTIFDTSKTLMGGIIPMTEGSYILMWGIYPLQGENYLAFSFKVEPRRASVVVVKDKLQIYSNEVSTVEKEYFLTPLVCGFASKIDSIGTSLDFKCMDIIPAFMTYDEIIQIWDDVFSYASYSDKIKLVKEVVKQGINPADYNLLRSSVNDERDILTMGKIIKR